MAEEASPEDDDLAGDKLVENELAQRFITALRRVEDDGDLEMMAALFSEDAELHRLGGAGPHVGPEGARQFWTEYGDAFAEITSRFTRASETPARVVLEWTTQGTHLDGRSFGYDGVSLLDLDSEHGQLRGFRTYYDTAALRSPPAADTSTASDSSGRAESSEAPAGESEPRAAAPLDHTARDSGFIDDETLLAGRANST